MGEKDDRLRGQRKEMQHLLPLDAAHLLVADRVINEMLVQPGGCEIQTLSEAREILTVRCPDSAVTRPPVVSA